MWYLSLYVASILNGQHVVNLEPQPRYFTSEHACVRAAGKLDVQAVCKRGIVIVITGDSRSAEKV